MSGPLVLALEGSTGTCSAALVEFKAGEDGEVSEPRSLSTREIRDGRAHARMLLRLADDVLGEMHVTPRDLRAVAVGTGPGTFTGVRVTVATARGMALALDVPIVGVSTLSALAAAATSSVRSRGGFEGGRLQGRVLVPVVDARRGQIFYSVYTSGTPGDEQWTRLGDIGVCGPESLSERLETALGPDSFGAWPISILGEPSVLDGVPPSPGLTRIETEASARWLLQGQASLDEPAGVFGGSRLVSWLRAALGESSPWSAERVPPGSPGTPEAAVPIYVRPPDADLHITKMRDPWGDDRAKSSKAAPGKVRGS
jgi:tRNA threonylcarbamoyl adenosine modification protein YeaZ